MARKFSSVGSTLRTSTPSRMARRTALRPREWRLRSSWFSSGAMSSSAVESLGCRLWVLTSPAASRTRVASSDRTISGSILIAKTPSLARFTKSALAAVIPGMSSTDATSGPLIRYQSLPSSGKDFSKTRL